MISTIVSLAWLLLACSHASAYVLPAERSLADAIQSLLNDTAFAITYSSPLVSYAIYASSYIATQGAAGINVPHPQRQLSTADSKQLVKPNVDNLYTPTVYDLSRDDLIVHVPQFIPGRYWSFAFFDPYGDNYEVLGVADHTEPGDYVLKLQGFESTALSSAVAKAKGVIESTTAYGVILVRYLVIPGNQTSVEEVHPIQDKIKITRIPRTCDLGIPTLYSIVKDYTNPLINYGEPERQLQLLAAFAENNKPLNPSLREPVSRKISSAGVVNGQYTKPQGLNLTAAAYAANVTRLSAATGLKSYDNVGNKWVLAKTIGIYGADFAERAVIGLSSYLAMIPEYQIYPTWLPTITGKGSLAKGKAYLLTFSSKPLIASTGYWSVTLYNSDYFLVANKLDRYSLGDRSNMTYPDGKLVYGSNTTDEGEFQMLLQAADEAPPANWTSNWLPTPKGGGAMTFNLRFGVPKDALIDGTYTYPKVQKVDAIVR